MTIVTERLRLPGNTPAGTAINVQVHLVDANGEIVEEAYHATSQSTFIGSYSFQADDNSEWQVDLAPNAQIEPMGTLWRRTLTNISTLGGSGTTSVDMDVPDSGTPLRVDQVKVV